MWTEEGYSQLHDKVRAELNDTVVEIAKQVEADPHRGVQYQQTAERPGGYDHGAGAVGYQAQMAGLVYRGFVTGNGFPLSWRYAALICRRLKRLEKMAIDPHRDRAQSLRWRACSRRGSSG